MQKLNAILALLSVLFLPISSVAEPARKVTFGYLVAAQLHQPALMVMKQMKLLEKRGYTVKWQEFLAGANLTQHMVSGEVDFGICGAAPVLTFRGLGLDFAMLASSNTNGTALIVAPKYKDIQELDGKSIGTPGIGSIQDVMLNMIAKRYGIKLKHRNMKVSDMPLFLKKGEIDGFIAWEPHVSRAEGLGYGHVLLTSEDILPGHECCVLMTREKTIQDDPQRAADVLEAYLEAMDWFLNNQQAGVEMISKLTGIKHEDVIKGMQRVSYPVPPYLEEESMVIMVENLVATKKIDKKNVPDARAFVKAMVKRDMLEKYLKK